MKPGSYRQIASRESGLPLGLQALGVRRQTCRAASPSGPAVGPYNWFHPTMSFGLLHRTGSKPGPGYY